MKIGIVPESIAKIMSSPTADSLAHVHTDGSRLNRSMTRYEPEEEKRVSVFTDPIFGNTALRGSNKVESVYVKI